MTVGELLDHLNAADPSRDVLIHDPATDDDVPVGDVKMPYEGPVVLIPE